MTLRQFCLVLISVFSMNAQALENTERNENRVSFSVTESAYFNNDQVTLTFRAYSQNLNPQVVANEINTQMQAAYAVLKRAPQIKVETSDYQIQPIYDKNQALTTWRGQQTLTLNMENQPGLVKIMAQIQPYLRYQNMEFGVSSAQRQLFIDDLTNKAIATFQKKAQLIAQGFNANQFKLIETHIQSPHFPSPYLARNMMASDAMSNAPVMQAGQSQLSVTINGTLLLPN